MKIAIDTQTTLGRKSGFGFYIGNLVKGLKNIDKKNEYCLINKGIEKDLNTLERFCWDQFGFLKRAKRLGVDIAHQPCFSVPIFGGMKKVATIHDLIPVKFPKNLNFASRMFFTKWMPFTYGFADAIIAISESTKKDLVDILKLDPERITVIYEAAGDEYRIIEDFDKIEEIKNKYKIKGRYILNVGTLEPRKNIEFLVKVFADVVKREIMKLGNYEIRKLKLVLVGKKGWGYEKMFDLIKNLGIEGRVVWTDYVEDEDLPYIYNGADLFVFPSEYEGFGLPLLEAMSCGVPVISSNTSSMPEVVSEAGILIAPDDENKWVENIIKVLGDSEKQREMRSKGLKQAGKFSWEKCAEETLGVYKKILNIEY